MWNAKENSLFKDESCRSPAYFQTFLHFDTNLRNWEISRLLKFEVIQKSIKHHYMPHQQKHSSGPLTKFAYDKPSISQQVRTSSSHPIPPSSEFMRLEPSWTPHPPQLQLFHFFLLLLSGREGLGHGAQMVWAFRCTWGYQHGTVWLLLATLTSSGFLGLVILPFLLSFLPSMRFLLRNHLYFTPQTKKAERNWRLRDFVWAFFSD